MCKCLTASALVRVLSRMRVNISNELNFSDVYIEVGRWQSSHGALRFSHFAHNPM